MCFDLNACLRSLTALPSSNIGRYTFAACGRAGISELKASLTNYHLYFFFQELLGIHFCTCLVPGTNECSNARVIELFSRDYGLKTRQMHYQSNLESNLGTNQW